MDTKLTLRLDKFVIDRAKKYAASHQKSLSRLIEAYLRSLTELDASSSGDDFDISPFVESMRTGVQIPANYDYKKAYGE